MRLLRGFTPPVRSYAALTAAIEAHPFASQTIGNDTSGRAVYLMTHGARSLPTFFLSCCLHGSEKNAAELGLEFARRWAQDAGPEFAWLRANFRCAIIPCASPYGFDTPAYGNPNGINLNRNFDNNWEAYVEGPSNMKGSAPFSEVETQMVRDIFLDEKPLLAVDVHTNSGVMGMDVGKVYRRYRRVLQPVYDTLQAMMPTETFLEYSVGTSPSATGWYGKQMARQGLPTIPSILEPDERPANIRNGMSFGLTALYLMGRQARRYLAGDPLCQFLPALRPGG